MCSCPDVADAAECPEEGHARLAPKPSFDRRLRALVGARLRMNTVVVTASPQNLASMPLAFIMDRAMPTTV